MTNTDSVAAYQDHVAELQRRLGRDEALRLAVGGDFIPMGRIEYFLLQSLGLRAGDLVIDVGCGSGRLAYQLAADHGIRYLGTDVAPDLLQYAAELCGRRDFEFEQVTGMDIPAPDAGADFVAAFSVFTHLLHEDTFRYFREAARVLKPGGCLVFSFLEFRLPLHWEVFRATVDQARPGQHLNQFIERDAILAWAPHAGFEVESIHGGDTAHIPLAEPVALSNGVRFEDAGSLGQSVAVLRRGRA